MRYKERYDEVLAAIAENDAEIARRVAYWQGRFRALDPPEDSPQWLDSIDALRNEYGADLKAAEALLPGRLRAHRMRLAAHAARIDANRAHRAWEKNEREWEASRVALHEEVARDYPGIPFAKAVALRNKARLETAYPGLAPTTARALDKLHVSLDSLRGLTDNEVLALAGIGPGRLADIRTLIPAGIHGQHVLPPFMQYL